MAQFLHIAKRSSWHSPALATPLNTYLLPFYSYQILFAYCFQIMGTMEIMVILVTPLPLAVKIVPPEENLDPAQIHLWNSSIGF